MNKYHVVSSVSTVFLEVYQAPVDCCTLWISKIKKRIKCELLLYLHLLPILIFLEWFVTCIFRTSRRIYKYRVTFHFAFSKELILMNVAHVSWLNLNHVSFFYPKSCPGVMKRTLMIKDKNREFNKLHRKKWSGTKDVTFSENKA